MFLKLYYIFIIVVIAVVIGCSGMRSAKKDSPPLSKPTQSDKAETKTPENSQAQNEQKYSPPSLTETDKLLQSGVDPQERAEVNQAALDFAQKNIPGVKHIKTCYSKLYGGWYMLLAIEKGKKLSFEHWSWNAKSKEWEVVMKKKDLSPSQMDFELKGEVAGEKCFMLK